MNSNNSQVEAYESLFVSYMCDQQKNNHDSIGQHDYVEQSGLCEVFGDRWERVPVELWDKVRNSLKSDLN